MAFAREIETRGRGTVAATVDAAGQRPSPILMTCSALIVGVLPPVASSGAGAEMRDAAGVVAVCGMLVVTFFGRPSPRLLDTAAKLRGAHQTERSSSDGD